MSSFLPEDDREYLKLKAIKYEELSEKLPNGQIQHAVLFPEFQVPDTLRALSSTNQLEPRSTCELLIVIPQGYTTTKLDSFYTLPRLKRLNGSFPNKADAETDLFGRKWQFWSRHIDEKDWDPDRDGLSSYLNHIYHELKSA